MKKTRFYSLIAILLMFVVLLTCGFLFACGSDDEEDVPESNIEDETPDGTTDDDTDEEGSTDPTEYGGDYLVSIYDGTADNFGGNNCYADFRNLHELTVDATVDADGDVVYAIEGMATLMTKSQIYAFNAGENENGAKTGDAFILVGIAAPQGSTIDYDGVKVTVTEDPTDGVFIQKISAEGGKKEKPVTITYEGNTTVSFVISLENITIPSDYIIGTWSNETIGAMAMTNISATASVELTINEDYTYMLTVSNISALNMNFDGMTVVMEGTWSKATDEDTGDMEYTLTGEEGNSITITLAEGTDDENCLSGENCLTISFSITFSNIPITVTEQKLYAGALETSEKVEDENEEEIEKDESEEE